MQLSCSFAPSPFAVEHARLAEQLGYARIWLYDSPVLYGDVWVTLARVAEATHRIGLGPGVLVPGLRHAAVTASAIATLEDLAPGRVAVSVGTGFTGRRLLGQSPVHWAEMEKFLREVRGLLHGREVVIDGARVRLMHPVRFAAPLPLETPILVAANGPRGLAVARALGDGVMGLGGPEAGFGWCALMRSGTVLDARETLESPRVQQAIGPGIALIYHATYESGGEAVDALPGGRRWREAVEAFGPDERHRVIHEGHCVEVPARERPLLDPQVGALTFTGTEDELRGRMHALAKAGATELVYSPTGPDIPRELRTMARVAEGLAG